MEDKEANMAGKEMKAGISEDQFICVPVPMISQDGERYFSYVSLPKDYTLEDHKRMMSILALYVKEDKRSASAPQIKSVKGDDFLADFKELPMVNTESGVNTTMQVNSAVEANSR